MKCTTNDTCICSECFYSREKMGADERFRDMCTECFANYDEFIKLMCDRCIELTK